MNLHDLVSQLIIDTKGNAADSFWLIAGDSSLGVLAPELVLCATVLIMLLARVVKGIEWIDSAWIALGGSLLALYSCSPWLLGSAENASLERMEIFTGMLVYDSFAVFTRSVLLLFLVLFILFTKLSGLPDAKDGADIYTLVFGATLGMCLMTMANHLLIVFLGVEMASVPSYALAGMLKGKRQGSEAALKYAVYGAGSAGVMLYGISLLAGLLNTAHLPTLTWELSRRLGEMNSGEVMVLAMSGLMIGVGLAYKLSAVPFHFWAPDVFEGASAEVNAFLSVASKAGALALLVRVAIGLGTIPPEAKLPGWKTMARTNVTASAHFVSTKLAPADSEPMSDQPSPSDAITPADTVSEPEDMLSQSASHSLEPVRSFIAQVITLVAILTCTFGNFTAYGQTNIKRMFAYSTIAHAGYMMLPVGAAVAVAGVEAEVAQRAIASLGIYMVVYLFMNLGAFAAVAFLRNALYSEEIADYAGLIKVCPGTVVCFCAILFGLIGLPPLAGFIGKFAVFAEIVNAYQTLQAAGRDANYLLVGLVVASINTAISLYYYLHVAKVMTIDNPPEDRRPFVFSDVSLQGAYLWLITLPTLGLILSWESLARWSQTAARYLFA